MYQCCTNVHTYSTQFPLVVLSSCCGLFYLLSVLFTILLFQRCDILIYVPTRHMISNNLIVIKLQKKKKKKKREQISWSLFKNDKNYNLRML